MVNIDRAMVFRGNILSLGIIGYLSQNTEGVQIAAWLQNLGNTLPLYSNRPAV
jgi:hypothetical protein